MWNTNESQNPTKQQHYTYNLESHKDHTLSKQLKDETYRAQSDTSNTAWDWGN